jgi:hypothetical protein
MPSRNANKKMQQLAEPTKVLINGRDRSSPQANAAPPADQNSALLAQNLWLLNENLKMLLWQSQGTPPMSYAPPGFRPPPGLPAPTDLHECRNSPKKGKGAKTRPKLAAIQEGDDDTDSTATGDVSSLASSVAGDHDEVDQDKSDSELALMRTTVMMRNLPNDLDREQLVQIMDEQGFEGCYDLVYVPIDFKSEAGLGYAFINLKDSCHAERFFQSFQGYDKWPLASEKVCDVSWSVGSQGLEEHVNRYRNSPVMHESVPDRFRPLLFKDGSRVPFPEPTKRIRAPRLWSRRP